MNSPFSIIKQQLQSRILSNLLCFCRTGVKAWRYHKYYYDTSLVSDMYIMKEVFYVTASVPAKQFFNGSFTFSREHLTRFICQGQCVCFTTLVVAIHYNQRSVLDSRKVEEYVFWGKPLQVCCFKGVYLFLRTSCNNFCLKSAVLNAQKTLKAVPYLIVLIWQFHNGHYCSCLNFLEEHL